MYCPRQFRTKIRGYIMKNDPAQIRTSNIHKDAFKLLNNLSHRVSLETID